MSTPAPTRLSRSDRMLLRLTGWAWLPYAAAAVLTFALLWVSYDLGSLDWRVPLYYNGDALAVGSHFKTIIETGWYEYQPNLGAPFGQHYNDYPEADNLHFFAAAVLSLFTHDFGAVMNIYFVIGFPLAALGAVWFFRLVGVSRILSVALAVVFALAPYHFIQGEGHLFLATYFMVPLVLGLIYLVAVGRPLWRLRPDGPRWRRMLTWRNAGTVLIAAVLGTASTYYSFLAMLLLAIVGVASLWRTHSWKRFLGAAGAGLVVVFVMVLNMLPDMVYEAVHGTNHAVLVRSPPESEHYALKLAQLLLPMPGHRYEPFRTLRGLYDHFYPLPSEEPALGIIAAVGFVAAIVFVVYFLLSAGRTRWGISRALTRKLSVLSGLTVLCFLFGTVGGLSTLVSFLSLPIRAWGRIAIFIALLTLAMLGLLLDLAIGWAIARARGRAIGRAGRPTVGRVPHPGRPAPAEAGSRRGWLVAVPLAVLLMGIAVWDQVPPVNAQIRADRSATFGSDQAFVGAVEARVPDGSLIYQLPFIPFPESPPVNGVTDTDELRMFLHSTELRWSAGGIKGRPEVDRTGSYASLPVPELLAALQKIDARGVVVDRAAYPDHGTEIVGALEAATGHAASDSRDDRFAFLPLP